MNLTAENAEGAKKPEWETAEAVGECGWEAHPTLLKQGVNENGAAPRPVEVC